MEWELGLQSTSLELILPISNDTKQSKLGFLLPISAKSMQIVKIIVSNIGKGLIYKRYSLEIRVSGDSEDIERRPGLQPPPVVREGLNI
jgi:hypothetical protein